MEEMIFRGSQNLENLQIQLSIVADQGKAILQQFLIQARSSIITLRKNIYLIQGEEAFKQLWTPLVELGEKIRQFLISNINTIYSDIQRILVQKWTKENIYFACIGFILGLAVGIVISLIVFPREENIERYMQAIQCSDYNGVESAKVVENARAPYINACNEVLVNVKAASVNVIDAKICNGYGKIFRSLLKNYISKSFFPVTLGQDCAGIVIDVGKSVNRIEVGDEVWLTVPYWQTGTLSQTVLVSENLVSHKPRNAGFEAASSLPYAGSQALRLLEQHQLTDEAKCHHKRVLLIGGCTPIGCVLLQLLKYWKAHVTTTCFKKAGTVCKALGADDIIFEEYLYDLGSKEKTFNKEFLLKEIALRELYDVIFITNDYNLSKKELNLYIIRNGIVVSTIPPSLKSDSYGFVSCLVYWIGIKIKQIFKNLMNADNQSEPPVSIFLEKLKDLVENGKLQTVVDKVCPPTDVLTALTHIQSTESIGSTIITFR